MPAWKDMMPDASDGPDIVIAGYAGEKGAVIITEKKMALLSEHFRDTYLGAVIHSDAVSYTGDSLCFDHGEMPQRHAGKGGVAAALYLLAKEYKAGMEIKLKRIPVRQSTVEICEYFGLNPYRLYSDCTVILAAHGERLAEKLNNEGVPAAVIGFITKGPAKIITDKTETEYLNKPSEDEILKILPGFFELQEA